MASPDDRGVQSGSGIRRWSFAAAGGFLLVAVVGGSMWLISGQGAEPPPATVASAAPSFADVSLYPRFSAASDAAEEAMSPSTPGDLELPEVDPGEAGSVAGKLNGDGASLIEFFVAAEGLWDQAPLKEDVCESARERFEAIASPPDLVSAASDLDDIPASDVLGSLVSITALVVSDCGADEANVSEMAWHWAVAYRRLAELGVEIP